jgi:hypothetical protein
VRDCVLTQQSEDLLVAGFYAVVEVEEDKCPAESVYITFLALYSHQELRGGKGVGTVSASADTS